MNFTKTSQASNILKEKVNSLIQEVNSTHRYSMSRIYGLYNEVFAVAEAPQSCASCLIRKVNQLKSWLSEQLEDEENVSAEVIQTPIKKEEKTKKSNK